MGKASRARAERRVAPQGRSRYLHALGPLNPALDWYEDEGLARVDRATAIGDRMSVVQGKNVPCKRGCHGCCYQAVIASMIEGVVIARHLIVNKLLSRELLDTLVHHEKWLGGMNREEWFDSATPCAFLTSEKDCLVYPVRPVACRTYKVISDPRLCYPPNVEPVSVQNGYLATVIGLEAVLTIEKNFSRHVPEGVASALGPLPDVVLTGLDISMKGFHKLKEIKAKHTHSPDDLREQLPLMAGSEDSDDLKKEGMKAYVQAVVAAVDDPALADQLIAHAGRRTGDAGRAAGGDVPSGAGGPGAVAPGAGP